MRGTGRVRDWLLDRIRSIGQMAAIVRPCAGFTPSARAFIRVLRASRAAASAL